MTNSPLSPSITSIDDATRFDVGTCAYAAHENSTDATDAVRKAIATFGAPHELLSDNGAAFCEIGVVGTGCLRSWYWGCA